MTSEPLAPADLAPTRSVTLCRGDEAGWDVDLPYASARSCPPEVQGRWAQTLQAPIARLRLSRAHACVLRVHGVGRPLRFRLHPRR